MKLHHAILTGLLASTGSLLATGCAHAPKPQTEEIHNTPVAAAPAPAPEAAPAPVQKTDDDLEALLRGDVLHFGFDEAELTPESRSRLQHIAELLLKRPAVGITISGNTDERGTEEYNLALGQRRAEVARKYLLSLGLEAARVKTVSYGKERPANPGHDDQAWAENRRDELSLSPH